MTNLYFFPDNNFLCWIAGYTADDNTSNLAAKIAYLKENGEQFAAVAGVPFESVQSEFVTHSRRFKNMRFFFCPHTGEDLPEGAKVMEKWTMWEWIGD